MEKKIEQAAAETAPRCSMTFSTSVRILTKRWPQKWIKVIRHGEQEDAVLTSVGGAAVAHILELHGLQVIWGALPDESSLDALRERFMKYTHDLERVIEQHREYSCVSGMTSEDLTWLMGMFECECFRCALSARCAMESSTAVQEAAWRLFRGEVVTERDCQLLNQAWVQFCERSDPGGEEEPQRETVQKVLCGVGSWSVTPRGRRARRGR